MKHKFLLHAYTSKLTFLTRLYSQKAVKLHYFSVPPDASSFNNKSPLVIIHGLFGHSGNWGSVSKALQHKLQRKVIVADLRNHGDSPHTQSMSYEEMASDVEHMIPEWSNGLNKCILLGHSLGGKVTSYLALDKPHLVEKLILEDIVPKTYSISRYVDLTHFVRAMRNSTWSSTTTVDVRREVDKQLISVVEDLATRQFLLTNLTERNGKVVWKLNLDGIEKFIPVLFDFPKNMLLKQYTGPTFVVWGETTIHLNPQVDTPYLKRLFPSMKIQMIPEAGHWIHSQKPKEFIDAVVEFLTEK